MPRSEPEARRRRPAAAQVPPPSTGRAPAWAQERFWLILGGTCLLSLLCRLVILVDYLAHSPLAAAPVVDAETYWDWAGQIANGRLWQDVPFFSAPLYPYLLGLLRAAGATLGTVYAIQMLADLATAGLLAYVCRGRFGAGVGLLAAGLFLLLQEPASSALRILVSSWHLLLVAIIWAALVRVQLRPSLGRRLAAGAAVGLLCLAYAPALALVVLVPAWLFVQDGRRVRDAWRAALPVATAGLVIAPATLHNYWASGELFLIRSGGGITLRQGNHPDSKGVYTPLPGISTRRDTMHLDAARLYREATGQEPTWKAVDKYFRDQVVQDWRSDPPRALKLAARKLYSFLTARNYGDIYAPTAEIAQGLNRWLLLTPLPVPWLAGPALVGVVLMLRRPVRSAPEWMLIAVPLLVAVVFFYSPRYRMPAVPIVVVTAAWAIERALHWRVYPRATIAVTAALGVGILLGVVNRAAGIDLKDPTRVLFNLGSALYNQGDVETAVEKWRAGLKARPGHAEARISLGDVLRELGRLDEALAEYERALSVQPDDAALFHRIGQVLCEQRRFAAAEEVLAAGVEKHPTHAILLSMLADTRQVRGQTDQARELLARALTFAPDDTRIRAAYGKLLMRAGRLEDAEAQFARIAAASPDDFDAHYRLGTIAGQLGDFERARISFARALEIRPQSVMVLHDLGVLNVKQGRIDVAAEYFRRGLAVDPADKKCQQALQKIDKLKGGPPGDHP